MKKTISIILIIIATTVLITSSLLTDKNTREYTNTHTKAICNETNFCQDYEIVCNEEELVRMSPLTGAVVQHSEGWQDPRGNETATKLC